MESGSVKIAGAESSSADGGAVSVTAGTGAVDGGAASVKILPAPVQLQAVTSVSEPVLAHNLVEMFR